MKIVILICCILFSSLSCTQIDSNEKYNPKGELLSIISTSLENGETYLLINNVEGLKKGLYRYIAIQHQIIEIDLDDDIGDRITSCALGQNFVRKCNVTFIWTADIYRMKWRYNERGYRG